MGPGILRCGGGRSWRRLASNYYGYFSLLIIARSTKCVLVHSLTNVIGLERTSTAEFETLVEEEQIQHSVHRFARQYRINGSLFIATI